MARKDALRILRDGTVINNTSEKREGKAASALNDVFAYLTQKYRVVLSYDRTWKLKDVVDRLSKLYPGVNFTVLFSCSYMKPDGGVISLVSNDGEKYPILITEMKNQGTNDLRIKEGKKKQPKGNAIERLGKNVIGLRAAFLGEDIFPFICFGDGCDFAPDSSILDRVTTIAMFGALNKVSVYNEGPNGEFNRGSFFFREKLWTAAEMAKPMKEIAEISIEYYFRKYGSFKFFREKD